jgi:hypothetical protein
MSTVAERVRRRLELHARGQPDAAYWALLDDMAEAADELEWMQVEVAVWRAYARLLVHGPAGDTVDTIMRELRRQAAAFGFSGSVIAARIDEFIYGPDGLIGSMT